MLQSNSLRKLENILDKATTLGNREENAGVVLLTVMEYQRFPRNLTVFYDILNQAHNDVYKIAVILDKNLDKNLRYVKPIDDIVELFILNHIWNTKWGILVDHIEAKYYLNILDALANDYNDVYHKKLLDKDFLDFITTEFKTLLQNISDSDLSSELKKYLNTQIQDILSVIRKYDVEGTAGLEKATKELLADLVIFEPGIKDVDKKNPVYKSLISIVTSLSLLLSPPTVLTIIGVVPDVVEFWIPQIEKLTEIKEYVEEIINEKGNIQDIFNELPSIFSKEDKKRLSGKNQKALPPATEIVHDETNKDL